MRSVRAVRRTSAWHDGRVPEPTPDTPTEPAAALQVLFVCTANICRSPYMELSARALGPAGVSFTGAGTHGFDQHPVDDTMAAVLTARAVDPGHLEQFRSRPLTRDLVTRADLVLTAEATHREFVLQEVPAAFRKVFTLGQFVESIATVPTELHGADLVRAAARRRAATHPGSDIADPYRRGPAAAEACADTIDALLETALPRLSTRELPA